MSAPVTKNKKTTKAPKTQKSKAKMRKNRRNPATAQQKMNRMKRNQEAILHATGAHGTDTRTHKGDVYRVGEGSLAVPTQDITLDISIPFFSRGIAYCAMGIVERAIKRGWLGGLSSKSAHPYYAFRYLIDSMKNAIQGSFPTLQSAPDWFWDLLTAFHPKTEPFKTGQAVYTGVYADDGLGLDPAFTLGTGDESYTVFWGLPFDATLINQFPTLVAPPAPYDFATNGQDSIQSLFEFFSLEGLGNRSDGPTNTTLGHDTSIFSQVYSELGASYGNPSGFAQEAYSERRIPCPLLAKFTPYQDTNLDFIWRGFYQIKKTGGTPCYIGPRMSEMQNASQLRNKCPPLFKFFNLDELFEIWSLTCCIASENLSKAGLEGGVPAYPLTALQTYILLRQVALQYCDNDLAQDLRLQDNDFIIELPMTVGPNGVSQIGSVGPQFPQPIVENLRCMKRITHELRGQGNNYVIDVIPVLARPPKSVISQLSQYTWVDASDGNTAKNFYVVDGAETPINVIDMSAISGMTTYYVAPTGPHMNEIVVAHNNWVQQMAGVFMPLATTGTECGPRALSVLPFTDYYKYTPGDNFAPQPVPVQARKDAGPSTTATPVVQPAGKGLIKKRKSQKVLGSERNLRAHIGAAPAVGSEFFQFVAHQGTATTLGFTGPLWRLQHMLWKPSVLVNTMTRTSSQPALQANWIEPFYLPSSGAYSQFALPGTQHLFPTAYEKHVEYATFNTRAYNTPISSELQAELEALSRAGDGGFLTSLAKAIGDGFGVSWLSAGARIVEKVVDI